VLGGTLTIQLNAKHPEIFSPPPRLWDLNWRAMGHCLVVELAVFAGLWIVMPPVTPAARLLAFAAGFPIGAGVILSLRLKSFWKRFLVGPGILLFLALAFLFASAYSHEVIYFLGGLAFGGVMIVSGFIGKPPISASEPNNKPAATAKWD
jgi:hypothetical protein